ncbi:MAG: glycosyltransferase family 2 protein [Hyphomonadaceae bacterium]
MKYSVVVPIYNDGYLAEALCEEVQRVFAPMPGGMELLFINDGSSNDSLDILLALGSRFSFVRVIDLSRNFGQHSALACGFREAKGEIVVRMNVDMQDPPAETPKLLEVMQRDDADLVVGQYQQRRSPILNKLTAYGYYALFKFLTGLEAEQNTSALRVMSRRFIDAYNLFTEKSRFPQGLDLWLGFKQRYVPIEHRARADGKSSYTTLGRLRLALMGLLYFSDRPIMLLTGFGVVCAIGGLLLGAFVVLERIFGGALMPGYASIIVLALTTFGIQLASIGLIGLYIGRIFREVQNRPLYLIREIYGQE